MNGTETLNIEFVLCSVESIDTVYVVTYGGPHNLHESLKLARATKDEYFLGNKSLLSIMNIKWRCYKGLSPEFAYIEEDVGEEGTSDGVFCVHAPTGVNALPIAQDIVEKHNLLLQEKPVC